jgi:8-oxo-dGTP pyrophosphatase MutT (NUDIX family)
MEPRVQYAALPYRRSTDGTLEIMLVTSRETRRWVIPKGWPMKGRKPHVSAAREAFEEAGLVGEVGKRPIGSYAYEKRVKDGAVVPCKVEVFPLDVRAQRKRWPEKAQRDTRWFSPHEAVEAVNEMGLRGIIGSFESSATGAEAA